MARGIRPEAGIDPRRATRVLLWVLAIAIAALGVVLTAVSGSWLPLLCVTGGIALPLIPIPAPTRV